MTKKLKQNMSFQSICQKKKLKEVEDIMLKAHLITGCRGITLILGMMVRNFIY